MVCKGNQLNAKDQRRPYDDVAPRYDAAMRPLDRWFFARLRARVLEQLPDQGRILEVGAGTGLNFSFYSANTCGVASEPSWEMLKIASQKVRPEAVRLVQSDAESLPFEEGLFDAAFATLVFCSVTSPARAFAELRRVVKPGGLIVLLEHVRPHGPLGLVFDLLNFLTVPLCADHVNRRTAETAVASGLRPVKVESRLLGIINLIQCRV